MYFTQFIANVYCRHSLQLLKIFAAAYQKATINQKHLHALIHIYVRFVRTVTELSINDIFTVLNLGCRKVICKVCKNPIV